MLEERTNALKLILDSAGDGFVVVNFDGSIHGDVMATARRWFGDTSPGQRAGAYLFGPGPQAEAFDLGIEQMEEQILPFDVAADAMPARIQRGEWSFALSFAPVFDRGRPARVLVTVRDVTARLAAESAERNSRELNRMVGHVLRDRQGFQRYVAEAQLLIDRACGGSRAEEVLRDLHTLKGASSVYGLETFASFVHAVESNVVATGETLGAIATAELRGAWSQALSAITSVVDIQPREVIEVPFVEHDNVVTRLERGSDPRELANTLRDWRLERVGIPLGRLAREAERLAARIGRKVSVVVDDGGVRLPDDDKGFWSSLVHVVRNAVDHGIEPPEERIALGKTAVGELRFTSRREGNDVAVTIADDGRGVDWAAVRERAGSASPSDDATEILFRDGFSTRSEASETSGRGVGLSAVLKVCRTVGARVEVESAVIGRGTRFRILLPANAFDPSFAKASSA
jgi:two-component system, chemotaxis family, sensor kinase CheA